MRTFRLALVSLGILVAAAAPIQAQSRNDSRDRDRRDPRDTRAERHSEFLGLDKNKDGLLSRNEWKGARADFQDMDVNRDGVLTEREYAADVDRGGRRAAPPETRTVDVDARVRWVPAALVVDRDDIMTFESDGSVQLSDDGNDTAIASGAQSGRKAPNAPMPRELAGALIAKIGSGAPFGVGDQRQIVAPASGQLYLGVNDDELSDNHGRFRVKVTTRPPY